MLMGCSRISREEFRSQSGMIKLYLKRPTKAIKPTMNHFSLFVNLLGWGTRSLGAVVSDAAVPSCSLDMASHRLTRDELSDKIRRL